MRCLSCVLHIGLLMFALHVAVPAPALAQERAGERAMSIFFDQGTAEIDPTAQKILAFVKNDVKPSARITITGHSDTSEGEPDKLSLARAVAVLNALVAQGMPPGVTFTLVGRGTTAPRKKTGPNVAEPINRNALIVIR